MGIKPGDEEKPRSQREVGGLVGPTFTVGGALGKMSMYLDPQRS